MKHLLRQSLFQRFQQIDAVFATGALAIRQMLRGRLIPVDHFHKIGTGNDPHQFSVFHDRNTADIMFHHHRADFLHRHIRRDRLHMMGHISFDRHIAEAVVFAFFHIPMGNDAHELALIHHGITGMAVADHVFADFVDGDISADGFDRRRHDIAHAEGRRNVFGKRRR